MIVSATRRVYIQSPYFTLDSPLKGALKTAVLTGVDVQVIQNFFESNSPFPIWTANTYIAEVVRAEVRVFLYQKGFMQTKTLTVDSSFCSVGSANIDIRSFSTNNELNAVLYIIARKTRDKTRDSWSRRSAKILCIASSLTRRTIRTAMSPSAFEIRWRVYFIRCCRLW